MNFLMWIAAGGVAGWLSGKLMRRQGYGWLTDVVMGITGALLGGYLLSVMAASRGVGIVPTTLMAVQGAILLTLLMALAGGKKQPAAAIEVVPKWRRSIPKDAEVSPAQETD